MSRLIAERFPATLELALVAAFMALAIGIPMGVYSALRRGTFLSQVFMTISLLGVSLPTFLIGILLILVFAVGLGWFPSFGRGERCRSAGGPPACSRPRAGTTSCACGDVGIFNSRSSCDWYAPRCWKCCAPTTSSSLAPAGLSNRAPSISAMRSRTRWCLS